MLKNFKRIIAQLVLSVFVLTVALGGMIVNNGVNAFADTKERSLVVMGDSISYGMSADKGSGFADLYVKHLLETGSAKLTNLSVPGYKASDLLTQLPTQQYGDALTTADMIVVSIGGNHLLSPVIGAMSKAFNVSPSSPTLLADLAAAYQKDPNATATLKKLQDPMNLYELSSNLDAGIASFKTEFPQVVAEIKKKAPNAQLYVLDLYNPFNSKDTLSIFFDTYITALNAVVEPQATTLGYTVVPVNKAFAQNAEAVKFNPFDSKFDPHPTNVGHDIINKQLIAVEKPVEKPVEPQTGGTSGTTTGNQGTTGSTGETKEEPMGLTDAQKQSFVEEITAASSDMTSADKLQKKAVADAVKLDKDYKVLKAKESKLKTKAEKTKLALQLAANTAKKKAALATVAYGKAIVSKCKMIIEANQAVLDQYEAEPDRAPLTQQELDQLAADQAAADKVIALKKTAMNKAVLEATKAAAKVK